MKQFKKIAEGVREAERKTEVLEGVLEMDFTFENPFEELMPNIEVPKVTAPKVSGGEWRSKERDYPTLREGMRRNQIKRLK